MDSKRVASRRKKKNGRIALVVLAVVLVLALIVGLAAWKNGAFSRSDAPAASACETALGGASSPALCAVPALGHKAELGFNFRL